MIAKVALGTLGLSGKYLNISQGEAREIIELVQNANFELIDSAAVYAENGNSIDCLIAENSSFKEKSVFFKIGANNLDANVDDLIKELNTVNELYGKMLKGIILHRTAIEMVDNHKIFLQFVREKYPAILLGISTYFENVLDAYQGLNIDVLQAPLNLVDYCANEKIFRKAKSCGMITQARSCLASGLLSGRYAENDLMNFKDSIRGRYKMSPRQVGIYNRRIKAIEGVRDFYKYACEEYALKISMSNFAYSVIANLEFVDHIIVGGTTFRQVKENISLKELPGALMCQIFENKIYEWQADSL